MHAVTPVLRSDPLSRKAGRDVWLLLDALQPTGSFKLRGVGHACRRAAERGATSIVSSSGGNAGLAAAYAGRTLGLPVTVVVPEPTDPRMVGLLSGLGAAVERHGAGWDEAHARAIERAVGGAFLVHPFEGEDLVVGNATVITEAVGRAPRPDVVVCAVGGGGLLAGVIAGSIASGLTPAVVAAETEGAASYALALAAGEVVTAPPITSVAHSLGARRVSEAALAAGQRLGARSAVCSDGDAVAAVASFLDDHRLLVEPACGAALAAIGPSLPPGDTVWVVVCGGAGITRARLDQLLNGAPAR